MMSPFTAEFIGTGLMILLGDGIVAGCVLKDTKTGGGSWMAITTAWAFAVFVGVAVAGPVSGAHLNPAVSIGLAAAGLFPWSEVPSYICAQFLGAMFGAFLMWFFYKDHFAITEDAPTKRACFCTEPAIRHFPVNLCNEIIGTFVLIFVIFYLKGADIHLAADTTAKVGLGTIGALPVAILVWVIGLSLGPTTGYAINPARDLGPRIILATLSKKIHASADWGYGWIPVLGPVLGAVIAAIAYRSLL